MTMVEVQMHKVVLSGHVVGMAGTWKQAERIVERALKAQGKATPEWTAGNTREFEGRFEFRLSGVWR